MRHALAFVAVAVATAFAGAASAAVPLTRISEDPYNNPQSQHKTQVEPDSFSFGNTIVSVFQTGRFFDGGASNIGFSTSTDGGATWTDGVLPNTTVFENGPFSRISDPVIAYDRRHSVWLASTLGIVGTRGDSVLISRSTDGLNWGNPIVVSQSNNFYDKNWTACDNTPSSPFYGHCYTEWDNNTLGNRILMSTSTDGGLTWSAPVPTANNGNGLGGLPVVRRDGKAVVPIGSANVTSILEYRSNNGGVSWGTTKVISPISHHDPGGGLRELPLPTADVDAGNKIYVVWSDCRFRTGCSSNDLVMSTNKRKRNWTPVTRIPIDPVNSGVDHFIPGIAVEPGTKGATAHLAVTYYYYPVAACNSTTCDLHVGFVESFDGGATWTAPIDVAGPFKLGWIANTSSGRMVGDYISTSFNATGGAHGVFAIATAPVGGVFDEPTATSTAPLFGLRAPMRPVTPADTVPVTDQGDFMPPSILTAY